MSVRQLVCMRLVVLGMRSWWPWWTGGDMRVAMVGSSVRRIRDVRILCHSSDRASGGGALVWHACICVDVGVRVRRHHDVHVHIDDRRDVVHYSSGSWSVLRTFVSHVLIRVCVSFEVVGGRIVEI